jgi:hypothetical protein
VLLVLLPTFAMWAFGILAVFRMSGFSPVDLSERRFRARRTFVNGIWLVLFSVASIHVVLALGTARLASFGLGFIIIVVYGILTMLLAGFITVQRGARQLITTLELEGDPDTVAAVPTDAAQQSV